MIPKSFVGGAYGVTGRPETQAALQARDSERRHHEQQHQQHHVPVAEPTIGHSTGHSFQNSGVSARQGNHASNAPIASSQQAPLGSARASWGVRQQHSGGQAHAGAGGGHTPPAVIASQHASVPQHSHPVYGSQSNHRSQQHRKSDAPPTPDLVLGSTHGHDTPEPILTASAKKYQMLPPASARGKASGTEANSSSSARSRARSLTPKALRALVEAETPTTSPPSELPSRRKSPEKTHEDKVRDSVSAEAIRNVSNAMAEAAAAVAASTVATNNARAGSSTPRMVIELSLNPSRAADNMSALRRARDALVTAQPELASQIGGDDFQGGGLAGVPNPFASQASFSAHHATMVEAQTQAQAHISAQTAAAQAASSAAAAHAAAQAASQAYSMAYLQQQQQQQHYNAASIYPGGLPSQAHAPLPHLQQFYYADGAGGVTYFDAPPPQESPSQPSLSSLLSGGNAEVGALFEALSRQQQDLAAYETDAAANEARTRNSEDMIYDLHSRVKTLESEKAATLKALVSIIGKDELLSRLKIYREAVATGRAPPLLTQPLEQYAASVPSAGSDPAWGGQHHSHSPHQPYAASQQQHNEPFSQPQPVPQLHFQRVAQSDARPKVVFGRNVTPRGGGRALQQRRAAMAGQPPPIIINMPPSQGQPLAPAPRYSPVHQGMPRAPQHYGAPAPNGAVAYPSPPHASAAAADAYMQQTVPSYAAAPLAQGSYYMVNPAAGVAHTGVSALPQVQVPTGITQSRVHFYSSAAEAARRTVLSNVAPRINDTNVSSHSRLGIDSASRAVPEVLRFSVDQPAHERVMAPPAPFANNRFSPRQTEYQGAFSMHGQSVASGVTGAAPAWQVDDANRIALQSLQEKLSAQADAVAREAAKAAAERAELDATWRARLSANNAAWESSVAAMRGAAAPPAVAPPAAVAPSGAAAPAEANPPSHPHNRSAVRTAEASPSNGAQDLAVEGALNRLISLAKASPDRFSAMLQRVSPSSAAAAHDARDTVILDAREMKRDAVRGSVSDAINSALRDQMAEVFEEEAGHRSRRSSVASDNSAGSAGLPVSRTLLRAELALLDRELLQEALAAQQYGKAQGLTPAGSIAGGGYSLSPDHARRAPGVGAFGSGVYFAKK
jgi:hypothetical protein